MCAMCYACVWNVSNIPTSTNDVNKLFFFILRYVCKYRAIYNVYIFMAMVIQTKNKKNIQFNMVSVSECGDLLKKIATEIIRLGLQY